MPTTNRLTRPILSVVMLPALLLACGSDPTDAVSGGGPLCCSEFKVGATINADIGGSAQSQVAAQAVADFAGIASAAVDDLTAACRSVAQDLDAPKNEQTTAEANADKQARLRAWCKLAVTAIGRVKASAGGSLTVEAEAPTCEASVSAKANCQAKCSGTAECDVRAYPPTCTGSMQIACKGECTAKGTAKLECEGSCSGTCTGSCTAKDGVRCSGKCEGECTAEGSTSGQAFDAQGNCQGTCKGTCSATAPGFDCGGSCTGECGGKCTGTMDVSVKCNGTCSTDFEPLTCEGGKLEGGCQVDAKCDANCDASVQAKAECSPPRVVVKFVGEANAEAAAKLRSTIEANMGTILALRARLGGMASIGGAFKTNVEGITDLKLACIPLMLASAANAVSDVAAASTAAIDVSASVGLGG